MSARFGTRRRAEGYSDPLLHALVAAVQALPLGRGPVATAVGASALIDLDHIVATRSLAPAELWTMGRRPPSHSIGSAVAAGAIVGAIAGPRHGWAAFGGLLSHILRDAVGGKTPLLWPWASHDRAPERVLLLAGAGLLLGSWAISRAGE
jgi:hypothetical protein